MYTRQAEGKQLTFGVSGKLYKDALVMFDRQTGSLWTQVDGSVLRGKMKGAQLERVPAVQTTWAEWKRLHPDTLVLRQEEDARGSAYANYFRDPERLGMDTTRNPDGRLPGKSLVVTLRQGNDSLAVPLAALQDTPLYQTTIAGVPVAIAFNPGAETPRVFDRRLPARSAGGPDGQGQAGENNRALDFEVFAQARHVILRDRQTGTRWSGMTGKALKGELEGQELQPVPYMVNFWFAWVAYNPRTRLEQP